MKSWKHYIYPFILLIVVLIVLFNIGPISKSMAAILVKDPSVVVLPSNEYKKNYDFLYVQESKDFKPYSLQELKNVFFSVLNNGWDSFTFYCPSEYEDCIHDVKMISDNQEMLTHINNYVHPFNSFVSISTSWDDVGEVTLRVNRLYSENEKKEINEKVDKILLELVNDEMESEEKIKVVHDYIIDFAKYDTERGENKSSKYSSNNAYGVLFEGYGICNGYTDAMAIFLEKMGFRNYKIATKDVNDSEKGHVWNAVYVEDRWLHLDLTWDDPVSADKVDYLRHKYFLVTNVELEQADAGEVTINDHDFKKSVYLEFNTEEATD